MTIHVIWVPYHLGKRGVEAGAGPLRCRDAGLVAKLGTIGEAVRETEIDAGEESTYEAVNSELAAVVRRVREADELPVVIAGNCNSALGTVAGMAGEIGVVWLDAHGDFNTRETTVSGSIEGMALAMVAERFVPEDRISLIGYRDLDPGERLRLAESQISTVPGNDVTEFDREHLPKTDEIYLHLDIDVLDPSVSPGTRFQADGGLTLGQLQRALAVVLSNRRIGAMAITNYCPDLDTDGRTCGLINELATDIIREAVAVQRA